MKDNLQSYLPNMITFLSLGCGLISIIGSGEGMLDVAGLLIIGSVILDVLDGFTARKLKVSSEFGKQLDSLVDVVCFGVAPIILVLAHLKMRGNDWIWILPFVIFFLCAGAFRLARFNIESQMKTSSSSMGITITMAGFIITLAVLSDLEQPDQILPLGIYIAIILVLGYMMTSRIKFPPLSWFVPRKWNIYLYIGIAIVLSQFTSISRTFLVICLGMQAALIYRYFYFSGQVTSGGAQHD